MKIAALSIALISLVAIGIVLTQAKSPRTTNANASDFPPEVLDKIEQARVARENVRKADPKFFEAVSKAMFVRDPIGINFETNADEYDAEAGTVIPRLGTCKSPDDVEKVLHEEFVAWFGASTAGEKERYEELAKDIWQIYKQKRPNQ